MLQLTRLCRKQENSEFMVNFGGPAAYQGNHARHSHQTGLWPGSCFQSCSARRRLSPTVPGLWDTQEQASPGSFCSKPGAQICSAPLRLCAPCAAPPHLCQRPNPGGRCPGQPGWTRAGDKPPRSAGARPHGDTLPKTASERQQGWHHVAAALRKAACLGTSDLEKTVIHRLNGS